jgi:hypothetical protein
LTTTNNKVENRLSEENGLEAESTIGISLDGFADPTGEYPRRNNWFTSSVSSAARGVSINDLWGGGSTFGINFDLPYSSPSIFPFNQANTTPSGHSFEIDDTPGNERVLIKHHTGAGVELKQDGSVLVASRSHQVQVVGADHELVVSGQGNLVYDGNLNLIVNGDYNIEVGGTMSVNVGGNFNHSTHGSYTTETGDIYSTIVRGNKDTKVWGDTFDFYCGEVKVVGKKDIRTIAKKDLISNAGRHVRSTAEEAVSLVSGEQTILTSKDMVIAAPTGKIGGEKMHYTGILYTGPDDDNGSNTVFQGNLVGRALEAWTSKFSKYAEESFHAHISNYATIADYADEAGDAAFAAQATVAAGTGSATAVNTTQYNAWSSGTAQDARSHLSPSAAAGPDYQFDWGWGVNGENTAGASTLLDERNSTHGQFVNTDNWIEVFNKTSPFAVRKVVIDEDNVIEDKISKVDTYSYYFNWTPTTAEIRSKLRTMETGNDTLTSPEGQTDGPRCISNLLQENRLHPHYNLPQAPLPYEIKKTAQAIPQARFGYTLLGNPLERSSKTFQPSNRTATTRTILAEPQYNPDRLSSPVSGNTKLSKSSTMSKFFGAPGSKTSIDFVPNFKQRQDLARQYYLHANLIEGVACAKEFSKFRLQVTEGFYKPASGIREAYDASKENREDRYWREPYRTDDGNGGQRSLVLGNHTINQLKYEGRAVVYTLYNSRGKIDYAATFDLSLYIRDTFFYDQLSIDYDFTRPDGKMTQQLIVVMPTVDVSFNATFQMQVGTYMNRTLLSGEDLVLISD